MRLEIPINVQLVKQLRSVTGLGLTDALNALKEANWVYDEALNVVRKRTGKVVDTRKQCETREGLCEAYVHVGGKIAVIVEVNCETDFVARTDQFKQFVKDICMQVAAANPKYLSKEDPIAISEAVRIEDEARSTQDLPPAALGKLVQGRVEQFYSDYCLLEQPFIRNRDKTIRDLLNEIISQTKENIRIRRFTRYRVGD